MEKVLKKVIACFSVLFVLIPCIFNSIYCFKFNVFYGLLSLIVCILLLLLIIMLFTHKKILKYTSIFLFTFSFIFFVVYHCTYKNSSEYRFKRIDYLYSKIYTKSETEKGDGWKIFNDGDGNPRVYYDKNKTYTNTNKNKILDQIAREELRIDLPKVENVSWNDEGIITWDDLEVDNSFIVYDVYVNDKKIEYESYFNTCKLSSITQNSYEIKIIAREKEQKYYNESVTEVTINYNLCTVTIVNIYGDKKNVNVIKGKKFEVQNYNSDTALFDKQLYYDKEKTSKCPDSILVNQNMTLYEGAKDIAENYGTLEINPYYKGVFIFPENCRGIKLKNNVTFPYITGFVYKYNNTKSYVDNIKKIITKCPNLKENGIYVVNQNYSNIRCIDGIIYADLTHKYSSNTYETETWVMKCLDQNKKDVILSSIATVIASSAFEGCYNLNSVFIPEGVTHILSSAFSGCVNLKEIFISNNVEKIGYNAFYGCSSLTIYCESSYYCYWWDSDWNSSNCKVIWNYDENK